MIREMIRAAIVAVRDQSRCGPAIRRALYGGALAAMAMASPAMAQAIDIPAEGESPTLDRIMAAGELRAGAAILAPWLLQDPNDSRYFGSVTVVAQATADALGVKLTYVDTTWDTLVAGLLSQKYDLAAGGILETEERKKVVDFVQFDVAGTCYILRQDSPVQTFEDLNDPELLFIGYTGLANDTMFRQAYPDTRVQQINPPPGYAPRADEVLSGRGDIAAFDSPLAQWVASRWPQARLLPPAEECLQTPDLERPISLGIPKGDEVFADLLRQIVEANKERINEENLKFSQPEFVEN